MIFRLLVLFAVLGMVSSPPTQARGEDDDSPGGHGFGRLLTAIVVLGVIILLGLVVLGVLSVTEYFEVELPGPEL